MFRSSIEHGFKPCPGVAPLLDNPIPFDLAFILRTTHLSTLFGQFLQSVRFVLGPRSLLSTGCHVARSGVESRNRAAGALSRRRSRNGSWRCLRGHWCGRRSHGGWCWRWCRCRCRWWGGRRYWCWCRCGSHGCGRRRRRWHWRRDLLRRHCRRRRIVRRRLRVRVIGRGGVSRACRCIHRLVIAASMLGRRYGRCTERHYERLCV